MQGARTTRTPAPSFRGKFGKQRSAPDQRAGQAVADPHRDRRRRRFALLHHVEMRVEGRDLVDFGEREPHLLRQRGEMGGREMAVAILDQVQMFDQQIAPARTVGRAKRSTSSRARGST